MIDPKLEKIIITGGMAITGWHALSMNFAGFPVLPEFLTMPLLGSLSVLGLSGIVMGYGIYVWLKHY